METNEVIDALSTDLRRHILTILAEGPNTTIGVLQSLNERGLSMKHRETVYRALERLVKAGLITKYYSDDMGLCYKLKKKKIVIEIETRGIKTS